MLKKSFNRTLLILLLYANSYPSFARSREMQAKDDKKHVDFGNNDPAFKLKEVPEKWKNESAVIINQQFEFRYKRGLRELHVYGTVRRRVKLFDKAAVEEFSEFYFLESDEVGFRVEKPDGKVIEVDVAKSVPAGTDPPTIYQSPYQEKQNYRKMAIPNLEPGDIIDYYYYRDVPHDIMIGVSFAPIMFTLHMTYPIMNQKYRFITGRRFPINVNSYNGAPQLVKRSDNEGDADSDGKGDLYELVDQDRDKIKKELFTYPFREYPSVKFQVYWIPVGARSAFTGFPGKPGEAKQKVTLEEVETSSRDMMGFNSSYVNSYAVEVLSYLNSSHGDVTDPVEIARLSYYYLRYLTLKKSYQYEDAHYKMGNDVDSQLISSSDFAAVYRYIFWKKKIPFQVVAGVSRDIGTLDDILLGSELHLMAYLPEQKRFIYPFTNFSSFEDQDPYYDGIDALAVDLKKGASPIVLPTAEAKQNSFVTNVSVRLSDDLELATLAFNRRLTGCMKNEMAHIVVASQDFILEDRIRYKGDVEVSEEKKKTDEYLLELKKKAMKKLEEEAREQYNLVSYDLFELSEDGRSAQTPELAYNETFTVKNLLNKAGNNFILDAGNLITEQIKLDEDQLKSRTTDVYITGARTYSYDISIDIPAGYAVEGYDQLNYNIDNEYGSFISKTEMKDNQLHITVRKIYKKNFVKKEEWQKVIAFLDPAYEFSQKKVILKKE